MTEKDLESIRSLRKEEWYLEERISELNEKKISLKSPSLEPSYGGNGEDVLSALIESIDKLCASLAEKQLIIREVEYELEQAMADLLPEERLVVRLYYLKAYKDWDIVASEMNYSRRRIMQFRNNAIKKLSNIALNCTKLHF